MLVVEHGEPAMFALIGVMRATSKLLSSYASQTWPRHKVAPNRVEPKMRDRGSTKIGVYMIWLLVFVLICAINVVAGRAHSRYLDRLEARSDSIQLFLGGSPDCVDQIKSVDH